MSRLARMEEALTDLSAREAAAKKEAAEAKAREEALARRLAALEDSEEEGGL